MIRHEIPDPTVKDRVNAKHPKWLANAAKRTAGFKKKKKYEEKSSIWSEVKPIYMELQGDNKCIYCERKFGSVQTSTVEHDLEHFRPKSHVQEWEAPQSLLDAGVKVTKPAAGNTGYYLLPYHLENYSSSCKTCNTFYKLDRFPVGGEYSMTGEEPRALLSEKPLLIYPVGDWDIDPETVIEFLGYVPQAKPASPDFHRGLVTIAFFGLDDIDMRSDLFLERAKLIVGMMPHLEEANDPAKSAAVRAAAQKRIERWKSSKHEHANCTRSFERLFKADRAAAQACYQAAEKYWDSKS